MAKIGWYEAWHGEKVHAADIDGLSTSGAGVSFGTSSGSACEGNDVRLSDARTPIAHSHPLAEVTGLSSTLAAISAAVSTKAAGAHTHVTGDVTGLDSTLAGLAAQLGRVSFVSLSGDAVDGDDGPMGPPGLRGADGITGNTGPTGLTGPMGPLGLAGDDGEDSWVVGPQGLMGLTGSPGGTGAAGLMGPLGPPGDDGDDGWVIGPPGPQGVSGPTGKSISPETLLPLLAYFAARLKFLEDADHIVYGPNDIDVPPEVELLNL